jgi:hypothetical protein
MNTQARPDHRALAAALRHRVLEGPAKTPPELRQAAAQSAAGAASTQSPYGDLAYQIGESAHRVTDAQVARVLAAAGSEKATFEIIIAAAVGAGLLRWQQGMSVLGEAIDAPA